MKTVSIDPTPTTFFLPADVLRAIYCAASKEDVRYYLNGVFVEKSHEGITLVATDGHLLMWYRLGEQAFVGDRCFTQSDAENSGFILRADVAEKAFKARSASDLWIYGDTETGLLQFVESAPGDDGTHLRLGVCEFERIDGTFSDWRRIAPVPSEGSVPVVFNVNYLDRFKAAQTALGLGGKYPKPMRVTAARVGDPMGVEFGGCPEFAGVLMPMKF